MESIQRRTFLSRSVAATAALGLGSLSSTSKTYAGQGSAESRRPNPIAVSTYSFWRFKKNLKLPIETCIDEAARMGFDGVDLLLIQMEREDNSYLQKIKRHALINGLDLCCMSTHQAHTGWASPLCASTPAGGAQVETSMSLWPIAASNRPCRAIPKKTVSSGSSTVSRNVCPKPKNAA